MKFRESYGSAFQSRLKADLMKISKSKKVIVAADKTRNWYAVEVDDYNKLLTDNVTQEYQQVNRREFDLANFEAKEKVTEIPGNGPELTKRMEEHTQDKAFITLKDHAENFQTVQALPCRLIKPSKSDIGKISKLKLEVINGIIKQMCWANGQ